MLMRVNWVDFVCLLVFIYQIELKVAINKCMPNIKATKHASIAVWGSRKLARLLRWCLVIG